MSYLQGNVSEINIFDLRITLFCCPISYFCLIMFLENVFILVLSFFLLTFILLLPHPLSDHPRSKYSQLPPAWKCENALHYGGDQRFKGVPICLRLKPVSRAASQPALFKSDKNVKIKSRNGTFIQQRVAIFIETSNELHCFIHFASWFYRGERKFSRIS